MGPDLALQYVNAAKSSDYRVVSQYSQHEDQGAFHVANSAGDTAVLKFSTNPQWKRQIERAKAATDALRPLGYPVPKYLYVDAIDTGTFWLENELPGIVIESPSAQQAADLIGHIEKQKGLVISEVQGQDWSWYVSNVVFRGESGLVRVLMQYSQETSALAAQIEALVLGLEGKVLGKSDLVHGDLGISQVLSTGTDVSGVIDWDQVGYGDRAMDLVALWYSVLDVPAARDVVFEHLKSVSDPQSIKIFAAYKMLAMVAWHVNKAGGNVGDVTMQAKTALPLLMTL